MKRYALLIIPASLLLFSPPARSDVTLTVGDGSGFDGSHANPVSVSLANTTDTVKQVQVDVCDADDYLTVNNVIRCETTTRTTGFSCVSLELPNGCARAILTSSGDPCPLLIAPGTGPVFTINYDVAGGAPPSGSRGLTPQGAAVLDENGTPLTVTYGTDGTFSFSACATAGDCNDGLFCNGSETCSSGVCGHSGDPCPGTECNHCNEADDTCFDPAGTSCTDDGLFCNGAETCDGGGVCGNAGDPCPPTTTCNETDDVCNCDIGDDCSDGLWCNGEEFCFLGECIPTFDRCTSGSTPHCDEANDSCVCCLSTECDDGLWCTGDESCVEGACEAGTDPCSPPNVCDEDQDMCVQPDVTVTVEDGSGFIGLPGAEVDVRLTNPFDSVNGVQMVLCDGNDYLTVSGCDEGARSNWGTQQNPACQVNEQPDGCTSVLFYNPDPLTKLPISPGSGVIFTLRFDVKGPGAAETGCNPFTVESLDVSDGTGTPLSSLGTAGEFCIFCLFDGDCADATGFTCTTGGGLCDRDSDCFSCTTGGGPCTQDSDCYYCNGSGGPCLVNSDCYTCTGTGFSCTTTGDCYYCSVSGAPCTIDDDCTTGEICIKSKCSVSGVLCLNDGDCPTGETCVNSCDQNQTCNKTDACDQTDSCGTVIPNVCTNDSCGTGSLCVHIPVIGACDDGLFCTDTSTCQDGTCVGSGDPCGAYFLCDEAGDQCIPCPDDYDCDGVTDTQGDNCITIENGPDYGTCAKTVSGVVIGTGVLCTSDLDCGQTEICEKNQEDFNANTVGDVCECYADINGDSKVNLSDLVIIKGEFFQPCPPSPCSADLNGDGKVDLQDLVIMKAQFLRTDCEVLP